MSLFTNLQTRFRKMVFLENKPETGEVFLNQRRVFTLPSKPGWMFLLLLITLFIAATNYNLSLGLALTFVLMSCAWVSVFLGFRNLAHLHLLAGTAQPVFAGEDAQFTLHLINRRKYARYAVWVSFSSKDAAQHAVDIAAFSRTSIQLSCSSETRGYLPIPRVRLQTWFPLGLLRAWSTWLPDVQALVYPRPELNAPPLPYQGSEKNDGRGHAGSEDFSGVRAYQTGDALKHLAWKHIAKVDVAAGGQLVTKQFSGGSASDIMLDFSSLPKNMDVELKLARMTSWVLEADANAQPYGFRLGGNHYAPATGQAHRLDCLRALALYEL
ncbi:DUF58 domain-containing protein [Undibacterium sp. RTI2.1]|uniref:DUF58 domain-containing protein n=1 Tax=unclassified Undibacterium TaxID=2630295 RepID=UPI002AB3BC1F|nr:MULTISPECIES: DUF58 domain-containing protein [unclassified Undibacterium]MDY7538726.1 DUF58 domain-containing protein [Undibacterium sp. 5I1]MEB0030218.1 DUF58 domain-containing protein [Undibacterium sp. RTI2.1]MEB0116842.1 DUF58 domain-containing protein [Undibacterium sp. RTI2.2]MEB0229665.1 DUF58 domain-containing protein [Undibacterium sp. 10I3]MEB0259344.1 DUF58 domain-containing protein [Undibacterium sp. 5I1]